jgi:hypothetical protein
MPAIQPEASGHFDCNQNRSVRRIVRKGWKKKLSKISCLSFHKAARRGCGHFIYSLEKLEVSARDGCRRGDA